jgi:hypothetical protein
MPRGRDAEANAAPVPDHRDGDAFARGGCGEGLNQNPQWDWHTLTRDAYENYRMQSVEEFSAVIATDQGQVDFVARRIARAARAATWWTTGCAGALGGGKAGAGNADCDQARSGRVTSFLCSAGF